jgi:HK97 family phage portal protein
MNFLQRFAQSWRAAGQDTPIQNATITTGASGVDLLDFFGVIPTSSGFNVTESTALTVATVYRCVAIIGGAIAQLPVHQFRVNAAGDREPTAKTPLWWLLNESPHDRWTAASWKEWIARGVLLHGDSFALLQRNAAQNVIGIRPLQHSQVVPYRDGDRLKYAVSFEDGANKGYDQSDILHFAGFGFDGVKSLSVIQWAARQGIGNALAASDYAGKTFAEGQIPQIALKYPNKMDAAQAANLRESFVKTYGGGSGRRFPLVLAEGGDVHELSLSPEDAQLIETRKYEKADICTAFGVPPIMIGDNEKTTSWGTGIEQITIGFVRYTLKPHLVRWEEELNRKLFLKAGQFVEFEVNGLLRGDSKAQADYYKAALGGPGSGPGWMSVNEVRKLQNLPPISDGDKPFFPQGGTDEKQATEPPSE